MTGRRDTAAPTGGADVVTILLDQLDDTPLFQLRGAVILPRGTVVELADGTSAQVQSLRLIAPRTDAEPARLVTHVVPVGDRPTRANPGEPAVSRFAR
jgi:hypothetical protein